MDAFCIVVLSGVLIAGIQIIINIVDFIDRQVDRYKNIN